MVELILGCAIGRQSTRNGTQFKNVFRRCVKDEDDERIVDGWKVLKRDADHAILWNRESVQLVCKAAIRCMSPSSKTTLSTTGLLDELRTAVTDIRSPAAQGS